MCDKSDIAISQLDKGHQVVSVGYQMKALIVRSNMKVNHIFSFLNIWLVIMLPLLTTVQYAWQIKGK